MILSRIFAVSILVLLGISLNAQIKNDTVDFEFQGKIIIKTGNIVKVKKLNGEDIPVVNQFGDMSKSFETELFGGKVTGWMAIGRMKVVSIKEDIISFELVKELSVITENGVKKNHFESGKEVKFVWKMAVSADEVAFKKGQDLLDKNQDEAMKYYKVAIRINPRNDKALNMIGMVMSDLKFQDSALIYFKKAWESNPKVVQYAKNICITSLKLDLKNDAYEFAKKAVICDSKDAMAVYLRSVTLYILKKENLTDADKKSIISDIDVALALNPDNIFLLGERAFFRKEFGNNAGACEDAKKAKELGAENGEALINEYCK